MTVHIAPADLRTLRTPRVGPLPGGGLTWTATVAVSIVLLLAAAAAMKTRLSPPVPCSASCSRSARRWASR